MTAEVEAFLAHYGVKGMKWGVRGKSSDDSAEVDTKPKSKISKKAVTVGATAVVGVAVAAYLMKSNNVSVPISSIASVARQRPGANASKPSTSKVASGKKTVSSLDRDVWKTQVKELEDAMKEASNDLYKQHTKDMMKYGFPAMSRKDFMR